jgi:hypothetical protein
MTADEIGGVWLRCWRRRAASLLLVAAATVFGATAAPQRTATKSTLNAGAAGSELRIEAANVQMLLIAPGGKETGYDAKTKTVTKEIPRSAYYEDALLAFDSGRVDPNTTQTVDVKNPAAGNYRLVVSPGTAPDGEEYEIRVSLYLRGGAEQNVRISGKAKRDRTASYELAVNAGSAILRVINRAAMGTATH